MSRTANTDSTPRCLPVADHVDRARREEFLVDADLVTRARAGDSREAISLAFAAALQLLPPRQRVVLVLRDVLGYRAREVAVMLEVTEESVTSGLVFLDVLISRHPETREPAETSVTGTPMRFDGLGSRDDRPQKCMERGQLLSERARTAA